MGVAVVSRHWQSGELEALRSYGHRCTLEERATAQEKRRLEKNAALTAIRVKRVTELGCSVASAAPGNVAAVPGHRKAE